MHYNTVFCIGGYSHTTLLNSERILTRASNNLICLYITGSGAYVYDYLITVRQQNAEGIPPENSQRHSLEQEITLVLILKSHSKSAAQIFKKLDRRFPHGARRLDSNWLEDEASAQLGVLGDFPDFSGVGDGSSGEHGSF